MSIDRIGGEHIINKGVFKQFRFILLQAAISGAY
jgi:hypothetical protein